MSDAGWFAGLDPDDREGAAAAIRHGRADGPADWPAMAVEAGFAPDEATYYERLNAAAIKAAREAAEAVERAPDQQLIHAVRAMDDKARYLT